MNFQSQVRPDMEVVGADGVHVGIVDHIDENRIKLRRKDEAHGVETKHHRYISVNNIASTEGGKLWLSAEAALVPYLEEEDQSRKPVKL